ncbi:MAG: AAA family ATPase [Pseudomonadota bacterium]
MKMVVGGNYINELAVKFPELSHLQKQLKFGQRAEVSLQSLTSDQLAHLRQLYEKDENSTALQTSQIAAVYDVFVATETKFEEGQLEHVFLALANLLVNDCINGWLYKFNSAGRPLPYLVSRIDFTPPNDDETGKIFLDIKANTMAKVDTVTLLITERDSIGKTIGEILIQKGFLKETRALTAAYEASTERYFEWRGEYSKQFSAKGTGIIADDPNATHRNKDWTRKSIIVLSSAGEWARLVNDEDLLKERTLGIDSSGDPFSKYLKKAGRSARYDEKVENAIERLQGTLTPNLFSELPVHGYVFMFHLELHQHVWVHVDDMKPYAYKPDLKDKLILPPEQTDLIDILTAEMDVLMDDIVEGKSGGTTVLCAGPAGVGKTLTAEVYSEIIQRPLYRVHSGQLGLSVAEMEVALKNALTRAQRWGAVMLIDEADVYIKRRDDNIAANAVVGVFLRVLEYFNGLLFLTTNRVADIDEAIVSRCIAMIRYYPPNTDDRRRIWTVMSNQFNLKLSDSLIKALADQYPQASGRDIKGLAKLTSKYCGHKSVEPTMAVFKKCSVFRGMSAEQLAYEEDTV